ncbi:SseB family protein [Hellea balneolensis]|uniref:SseB family protein n=1 Tax=Hellea balneolensis TaxID=287478 RepID=UPI00047B9AAE|nr:SseB family protein [Hellea balneolensis]
MSDFEDMLAHTTPEQLAGDPIARKAFSVAMLASDFYLPVEENEKKQADKSGISLQAVVVNNTPHVVIFSSEERMNAFAPSGTRFARANGGSFFPSLMGHHAILNPGPAGLVFTPEDIAEILGKDFTPPHQGCGAPGHVHGPGCQH